MESQFQIPKSLPTWARKSIPRTSTRLKPNAAAIPPMWATAPTASSTCYPVTDLSGTATGKSGSPPETSILARLRFRWATILLPTRGTRVSPAPAPTTAWPLRWPASITTPPTRKAPFYHYNQANYDSPANDNPVATPWHQGSNYVGGQGDVHADAGPNNFSAGFYTFYQAEPDLFGVLIIDGSFTSQPNAPGNASAALIEGYLSDHLRLGQYVTLLGG